MTTQCPDMTIAVDWDAKPQLKLNNSAKSHLHMTTQCPDMTIAVDWDAKPQLKTKQLSKVPSPYDHAMSRHDHSC